MFFKVFFVGWVALALGLVLQFRVSLYIYSMDGIQKSFPISVWTKP